jgi:hypothetical protein
MADKLTQLEKAYAAFELTPAHIAVARNEGDRMLDKTVSKKRRGPRKHRRCVPPDAEELQDLIKRRLVIPDPTQQSYPSEILRGYAPKPPASGIDHPCYNPDEGDYGYPDLSEILFHEKLWRRFMARPEY